MTLSFINSAIFIYNGTIGVILGKFRNLSQRLANIEMVFSNPDSSRVLNFSLMNRTLMWKIYELFLKHLLPHAHGLFSEGLKNIFYLHSYLGVES